MFSRETKKERKTMQINKNRKGLALGAVFALVASLFVGTAPAQANENAVVAFPAVGTVAQTTILGTETFDLDFRFGTNVASSLRSFTSEEASGFGVLITKPAGVTVSAQASFSGTGIAATISNTAQTAGTEFVTGFRSSDSPTLGIGLPLRTSVSAAVSLTVTPFLDLNRNGLLDAGEPLGAAVTLTFAPWSALGVALTLEQPVANSNGITGSFTVATGSMNWAMLDNDFNVVVDHTAAAASDSADVSASALVSATNTTETGNDFNVEVGNSSASFEVETVAFSTSTVVESVSATVTYGGIQVAKSTLAVSAAVANGVSISPVVGANAALTSAGVAHARFNSAFNVRAFAFSASNTTSMAVANAITVSSFVDLELDADSGVILNGVTYTSSARLSAAGFTLASGTDTFTVSTFGQERTSDNDALTLTITNGTHVVNLQILFKNAHLSVIYAPTAVAGLAGASKTFALSVEDQWGETPVRSDLRISATVNLGGSVSDAVNAAVVAGKANVTLTPVPATRTGSATVTFALQRFNQDDQAWTAIGTGDSVTWNVFTYAAGTDAITSRTASISASISYGVDLSWSAQAISVVVANSFSDVVVSAPGLMIRNADQTIFTASDTLTVAANGMTARFEFTSRLAGTYTVTFTNGTATTTSQVVVNPARDADGATITFDTTAIAAGSTKVITGTLVDANGNAVNTSGSATILVTYTVTGNAGIPIGTMPTETDADGKFTITVLTGANDRGTAVVSAAYYKSGAATPVAQVLTFNQSIVVGGAAAAPATDQKLTVGSFKGFVAIYALNYTGQKLSAKVAGKWLTVNNLSRFQRVVRNTGAAIPIVVDLYIDGKLVRTENIVTK
jgi:trimeric autotransporter adhesin